MRRIFVSLLAVAMLLPLAGCGTPAAPVTDTREVLGTAVTISRYAADARQGDAAANAAFSAMSAVEHQVSPYDPSSTIAAFNRTPFERHILPADALTIASRVAALGVGESFSPALFGVTSLYDFGGAGTVPDTGARASAVRAATGFRMGPEGLASFTSRQATGTPGLDFGGASKGLALDRAAKTLAGTPALLTAGSSTLSVGAKPDGEPWRVGIEDPREVGRVVAVVSCDSTLSVSTSGDYQTYFERAGVRYHHILDPATGLPAHGIRSLTVFGRMSALDADILSTALMVMGREPALDYALDHGFGLYIVDEAGYPHTCEPDANVHLTIEAEPRH